MRHWLTQVAISIDQLFNALLCGWADESLSSRAWRMWVKGKPMGRFWKPLIDTLFWPQARDFNHCQRAYENEKRRYNSPAEMRTP